MSNIIDIAQTVKQTPIFAKWIRSLRDRKAQTIIAARIDRVAHGNMGDIKSLGGGLYEIRVTFGAGYRVYYTMVSGQIIVLICGGDKSTQQRDIEKARSLMKGE